MALREDFSFFDMRYALTNGPYSNSGTGTGATIDTRGFDSVTFFVPVMSVNGAAPATSYVAIRMQHADASAAGTPDTWADCDSTMMIRTWSGAVTSGACILLNASTLSGTVLRAAYKGTGGMPKQFVRLLISNGVGDSCFCSTLNAVAMLGHAAHWPVVTPNLDAN